MAKDKDFPEILSKDESVNIQKADPNAPASEPKPAATVLLVRAPLEAVEVFMIKRNAKTNFGGAWVFPGGKLDPVDSEVEINSFCSGLTDEMASQILGLEEGGLNYWIACIRECFEECGVLLAYRENGDFFGSVSAGCVESAIIKDSLEIIKKNISFKKKIFKVSDENAWNVGLSCGGEITVYFKRINFKEKMLLMNFL